MTLGSTPRGSESFDWKSTLNPSFRRKPESRRSFELEPKTNLDAGVRRHDGTFTSPEGEGFQSSPKGTLISIPQPPTPNRLSGPSEYVATLRPAHTLRV